MELTDEQYGQIARYANGEMETADRNAFEAAMETNEALAAELKLYKELQSLYASATAKIENDAMMEENEKMKREEAVRQMIAKAREDWEAEQGKTFSAATGQNRKRLARIIGMQKWTMLAAAAVLGIIILVGTWLYQQRPPINSDAAISQPMQNPKQVVPKNPGIPAVDTVENTPDSDVAEVPPPEKEEPAPFVDPQELVAANFKPDKEPAEKDSSLKEPFAFYTAKEYDGAIEALEMYKAGLNVRSDEQSNTTTVFYVHYYLGLSYLAANQSAEKAIDELNEALKISTDEQAKSKVMWYLAMARLKAGETEKAIALLQQLANDPKERTYKPKVQELLHKLSPANKQ